MRTSAISANHLLAMSSVSSFVFIPYCHLIPLLLSVNMIAWLYPSIDVMEDEYKSMCTRPKSCEGSRVILERTFPEHTRRTFLVPLACFTNEVLQPDRVLDRLFYVAVRDVSQPAMPQIILVSGQIIISRPIHILSLEIIKICLIFDEFDRVLIMLLMVLIQRI
jgi:hypothetical protein